MPSKGQARIKRSPDWRGIIIAFVSCCPILITWGAYAFSNMVVDRITLDIEEVERKISRGVYFSNITFEILARVRSDVSLMQISLANASFHLYVESVYDAGEAQSGNYTRTPSGSLVYFLSFRYEASPIATDYVMKRDSNELELTLLALASAGFYRSNVERTIVKS